MKTALVMRRVPGGCRGAASAFTLTQFMVAMSIFLFVIGGAISAHVFGLGMFGITQVKLAATDSARKTINLLGTDIRSAKDINIGTGSATSFTAVKPEVTQEGNALQIYPTTDTNVFVRYYVDSDKKLWRMPRGEAPALVVGGIKDPKVFTFEDFAGNTLTNLQNNFVVGVSFDFFELTDPKVPIGPGRHYQSYHLQTKIARQAAE
ncbi:MAG: hypothetical protein AB1705_19695 [Verrucomicrobiota bacterium]